MAQAASDFDVLMVGAGISGIGVAAHMGRKVPNLSYQILERREELGGTWDLFRYPGIRTDSDMHTFLPISSTATSATTPSSLPCSAWPASGSLSSWERSSKYPCTNHGE